MDIEFATKTIEYKGEERSILMQNENGPCALIALVNVLLIDPRYNDVSQELKRTVKDSSNVSLENLLQVVAELVLQTSGGKGDTFDTKKEDTGEDSDVTKCLTLLPELHTGLNVNPTFDGGFKDSPELSIFRLLNIDLIHGWVLEDSTPGYTRLQKLSYDEAIDICTHASDVMSAGSTSESKDTENILTDAQNLKIFFDESPTQLTTSGIQLLIGELENSKLAVLFRNDHFATVLNHDGTLFSLVTDLGYKKKQNIVWESLLTIDGSGNAFFDSKFQESQYENEYNENNDITSNNENISTDHQIALQLQSEEDSKLAKSLDRKTASNSTRPNTKDKKKKHKKKDSKSKSKPKKSSNVVRGQSVTRSNNNRSSTPSKSSKDSCIII